MKIGSQGEVTDKDTNVPGEGYFQKPMMENTYGIWNSFDVCVQLTFGIQT